MQIKRFEAKTMTAALKLIKDEFGPDAVILSARTLRGSRGLFASGRESGVEVTAATDSGWTSYTASGRPAVYPPPAAALPELPESPERRGLLRSLNDGLRSLTGRIGPQAPDARRGAGASELAELHRHLLAQDVDRDLAADLIARMGRRPIDDPQHLQPQAAVVLQDMGLRQSVDAAAEGAPRVVALVGPSGVGKTTTAIKLAVRSLGQARQAALLSLDDHRIGAVEQLRIYADILEIPLVVATSADDARQALKDLAALDDVIVDTPGISSGEDEKFAELRQILEALKSAEIHLVLNASSREKNLQRVVAAWKGIPLSRLSFTRLDETDTCGGLLNLLLRTRLPLSYLSTGARIPEDLAPKPMELLLGRLFADRNAQGAGGASIRESAQATAAAPVEAARLLVANRNSDLYHRPECKWVRKIKRDNLVQFASAADAESRNFMPCRNCAPDHRELLETAATSRDGLRMSAGA